jgi:hypothetical protein
MTSQDTLILLIELGFADKNITVCRTLADKYRLFYEQWAAGKARRKWKKHSDNPKKNWYRLGNYPRLTQIAIQKRDAELLKICCNDLAAGFAWALRDHKISAVQAHNAEALRWILQQHSGVPSMCVQHAAAANDLACLQAIADNFLSLNCQESWRVVWELAETAAANNHWNLVDWIGSQCIRDGDTASLSFAPVVLSVATTYNKQDLILKYTPV